MRVSRIIAVDEAAARWRPPLPATGPKSCSVPRRLMRSRAHSGGGGTYGKNNGGRRWRTVAEEQHAGPPPPLKHAPPAGEWVAAANKKRENPADRCGHVLYAISVRY